MINCVHEGFYFQCLSAVQQIRISRTLSERKAAPWRYSILQKFGKSILTGGIRARSSNTEITECVDVNLGQFHIHIHENQTPDLHHYIWGGHQRWLSYSSIYLPKWLTTQHGRFHEMPGRSRAGLERILRKGQLEDTTSGNRSPCHVTQSE